jgi:hypothetical protein
MRVIDQRPNTTGNRKKADLCNNNQEEADCTEDCHAAKEIWQGAYGGWLIGEKFFVTRANFDLLCWR